MQSLPLERSRVMALRHPVSGVAAQALAWLGQRHGDAIAAAYEDLLAGGLTDAERDALDRLDDKQWQTIERNAIEWLIAEGRTNVNGASRRFADLLLGPDGPALDAEGRRWLEQLATQPLRVYEIVAIDPVQRMTLRDALDATAAPLVIDEVPDCPLPPGATLIGLRLIEDDGRRRLSTAAYPFLPLVGRTVVDQLREAVERFGADDEQLPQLSSLLIWLCWLAQHFERPPSCDAPRGRPGAACACGKNRTKT